MPPPEPLPSEFKSNDFIVAFARAGDTAESLADRYLKNSGMAWMIEDSCQASSFAEGQVVVIPRRDGNPPGVYPDGYQLVPVLVYHKIGAQQDGLMQVAAGAFEEQMQYLKREGYRAIRLQDFVGYLLNRRQLPKKSVLLTFDDGYKSFLQYADPVLKKVGFTAVLFIQSDQIASRSNPSHLSWPELRDLVKEGMELQPHSKTHKDLRRTGGESEAAYTRRMQAELAYPLGLFRTQLSTAADAVASIAYPYGECDENCRRYVKQHGYAVGFTVRRAANAAFEPMLEINRSQVYGTWTLDQFQKNLDTFQREPILPAAAAPVEIPPPCPVRSSPASSRRELAAPHHRRAQTLEDRGWLHQAGEENRIALTIDPGDPAAQERQRRLEARIENEVTARVKEAQTLPRTSREARRLFLAALALDPTSKVAFEALRSTPPPGELEFVTHIVRKGDSASSLALLYYNDRSRGENIEQFNGLRPGEPLAAGRSLRIPKIPGVQILPLP